MGTPTCFVQPARTRARDVEGRHAALCQVVAALAGHARGVVAAVDDPEESADVMLTTLKRLMNAADTALSRHGFPSPPKAGEQLELGQAASRQPRADNRQP